MFPLFLKRTADVQALRPSVVFRQLVQLGSFLACWRQANVTPIPKGLGNWQPSSSVANYRQISIISVFSKVSERLVFVRLGGFMERSGVFQPPSLLFRKVCVSHTLQSAGVGRMLNWLTSCHECHREVF